jgi:hypothetical protein
MEKHHLLARDKHCDGKENEVYRKEVVRTRIPVVQQDISIRNVTALQ